MGKTNFGISKITEATPKWVKILFAILFLLSNVATFIIAGDNTISAEAKVHIYLYVNAFNMFIFGLSKMFGIPVKETPNKN